MGPSLMFLRDKENPVYGWKVIMISHHEKKMKNFQFRCKRSFEIFLVFYYESLIESLFL